MAEIDVDRRLQDEQVRPGTAIDLQFGAVIGDAIVACACGDAVSAPIAVDRIRARTSRDRIRCGRAVNSEAARKGARIKIFKVGDSDGIAARLVRTRSDPEVNTRECGRRGEHERVDAAAAINGTFRAAIGDCVCATACCYDVSPTIAVDGIGACAPGDRVGTRRSLDRRRLDRGETGAIDVLEAGDGRKVAR